MISTSHCCCSLSYAKLSHVLVDHMRWTTYICSLWQNCVKYHSMLLTASSRSIEWLVHVGELMWATRARKNQEKDGQLLRKANLQNSGKIRWHRIHKCLEIPQGTLFLIQNKKGLSKISLWAILDPISHILICLCILTKMWSLLP
jgi:hypothetical protein